jgi:glutamate---cysteine ligase / carboxylate-amine ligase
VTSRFAPAPTLGVEEEFQLLDPRSGVLVSAADEALRHVPAADRHAVVGELTLSQLETVTPVCTTLAEVETQVRRLRGVAAAAAQAAGARIAASGTAPAAQWRDQRLGTAERYRDLVDEQRHLTRDQLIAGLHVHVGVPDRDRAVAVLDRIRVDLPLLVALAANSPYWDCTDTGFASWRLIHWARWPVSGAPPLLGDAAGYDAAVADLVATGAVADASKIYWDSRLSARFPTVEVRTTDVCLTVAETVLVAGLVRALVMSALADHDAGRPPVAVTSGLLRAAGWRAARDGLGGELVDLRARPGCEPTLVAAEVAIAALLDRVAPALAAAGDEELVRQAVDRVFREGTGAQRQRAAYARGGLPAVAQMLVTATA